MAFSARKFFFWRSPNNFFIRHINTTLTVQLWNCPLQGAKRVYTRGKYSCCNTHCFSQMNLFYDKYSLDFVLIIKKLQNKMDWLKSFWFKNCTKLLFTYDKCLLYEHLLVTITLSIIIGKSCCDGNLSRENGHLTRYAIFRVAHAPGLPRTFSPPLTSKETAS